MPTGGFCLWVELPFGYDSVALSKTCIEKGVVFAPGRIFSVNRDYSNYLRIGWGGKWNSKVAKGVRIVASALTRPKQDRPDS